MLRVYERAAPIRSCALRSFGQEPLFSLSRRYASNLKPQARPIDSPHKFAPPKAPTKQAPSPPIPPAIPPQKLTVQDALPPRPSTTPAPTCQAHLPLKPPVSLPPAPSTSTPGAPVFNISISNLPAPAPKAKDTEHEPQPLDRPIGQSPPPQPRENDGIDHRPWRQRRDDFLNYDKHLERRKELTRAVAKPYFREWGNMRHHKGKIFLSNPMLFKAERALYFPNLRGTTLALPSDVQDTTNVLRHKISVVSVFSGLWAANQTNTFIKDNRALDEAIEVSSDVAQRVYLNVEENWMRAGLVRMFRRGLRRSLVEEEHERYFLVRRGITERMREETGMLNSKLGYVFLVDEECRIRWAGSAEAFSGEKESLAKGVERLVRGWRTQGREDSTLLDSAMNAVGSVDVQF